MTKLNLDWTAHNATLFERQHPQWKDAADEQRLALVEGRQVTIATLLLDGLGSKNVALKDACKEKLLAKKEPAPELVRVLIDALREMPSEAEIREQLNTYIGEPEDPDAVNKFFPHAFVTIARLHLVITHLLGRWLDNPDPTPDAVVMENVNELAAELRLGPEWEDRQIADQLAQRIKQYREQPKAEPRRKRSGARPIATNGLLRVNSHRLAQTGVQACLPRRLQRGNVVDQLNTALKNRDILTDADEMFWAAAKVDYNKSSSGELHGAVGLRGSPSDAIWDAFQKDNALAVKVYFTLMARAFAETNGEPGQFITLDINTLCDDLGYKRKKGSHSVEVKVEVKKILHAVTRLEVAVRLDVRPQQNAKGKGKAHGAVVLKGPYWVRGVEVDTYDDLFRMSPATFRFAPGDFFNIDLWREYNSQIAFVGEGLLRLSARDQDKHALMLGAYIVIFAGPNGYRPKDFWVKTLLEQVFNVEEERRNRNLARIIDRLEKILDRLVEIGAIAKWYYWDNAGKPDDIDFDDLDSPKTRNAMAADAKKRRNPEDELKRTIFIEWPAKVIKAADEKRKRLAGK